MDFLRGMMESLIQLRSDRNPERLARCEDGDEAALVSRCPWDETIFAASISILIRFRIFI
jgi:hypothetical protein